ALRHGDRAAPRAARGRPRRRARPRGHLAAYRVQGSPSHRRPRSLPSRAPGGASVSPHVETLAREVVEGSPRALARALTWVESGGGRAAADAIDVLDAAGRSLILVETVGVGQDEVDVMRVAHTVVVVSVPGLGDDVQALKAGILEIADLHVVNKADREGADRTLAELR